MYRVLTFLFLVIPSILFAQRHISGKVTDESGELLIGATIMIKGTSKGTVTDINGAFTIKVLDEENTLVVSFIGYKTREIKIEDKEYLSIKLVGDNEVLDELVVVGYGTMKRSDLTGAISSIKSEDIKKSGAVSLQEALQGRVSGVQVVSSDGSPGGGMNVLIRGGNSVMNDNQPLYVVDGMQLSSDPDDPTSNPIAHLNPRDIESMEVLKDASATAIYGADGANGVIIITTKKGTEGKPNFDIYYRGGISEMYRDRVEFLDFEEYAWYLVDKTVGFNADGTIPEGATNIYAKIYQERLYNQIGVDQLESISQQGQTHDIGFSMRGGNKGLNYSLSTGYYNERGVVINSSFQRLYNNFHISQKVNDKLKLSGNLNYSYTKHDGLIDDWTEGSALQSAIYASPFLQFIQDPGNYEGVNINIPEDESTEFYIQDDPKKKIEETTSSKNTYTVFGRLSADYKLGNSVNIYSQFVYNITNYNRNKFEGYIESGAISKSQKETKQTDYLSWDGRVNFNQKVGKHKLNLTGIGEIKSYSSQMERINGYNFQYTELGYHNLNLASQIDVPFSYYGDNHSVAVMGRLNYNYNDKYLFTGTARVDGSSKFSPENRWGFFPSFSGAWYIDRENFMKSLKQVLSTLKLRVGYGEAGNNRTGDYAFRNLLVPDRYVYGTSMSVGMKAEELSNPDLKWETTSELNFGLDYGFLNSRITGSVELYDRTTKDIILEVQVPKSSGFSVKYDNVGELNNKGIEIAINTHNIKSEHFNWMTSVNISHNKSLVVDLGEKSDYYFSRNFFNKLSNEVLLREGEPVGIYYGYVLDGVYNSRIDQTYDYTNGMTDGRIGQLRLVDLDGDGVVTTYDKVPLAYTEPIHTGGINNSFDYKNIDLSVFFRWSYGNDVVNGNIIQTTGYRGRNNLLSSVYQNNWSQDNPYANYHAYNGMEFQYGNGTESLMSSMYVEDGSYLRLDNITLGYNFSDGLLKKLNIKKFRLYVSGRNLWVWSRYSWFDPEVSTGWGTAARVGPGCDAGSYPKSRQFQFGIDVTF